MWGEVMSLGRGGAPSLRLMTTDERPVPEPAWPFLLRGSRGSA